MKIKLFGTVLICAVLLLSGAACGGGAAPSPTPTPTPTLVEMTAKEIAEAAVDAGAELETYRFDMDMEMTVIGGWLPGTTTIDATGAIDEPNRKMYIDMDMRMPMFGLGDIEVSMEMYLIVDEAYMRMEIAGMPATWLKTSMTEELWEEQDISSQQLDLLEDFVEVELLGTETVGGVQCYKLDVTPDLAKLWDWAQMQEGMEEEAGFDPEDVITDFSITEWIATDTYFPVKAVIEMTMTIESQTVDMAMTMLMHHFNEPVTIVLPPEAEDAVEVESFD